MDGLSLGLETQDVNIIMGLKDNKECRGLAPVLEDMLVKYYGQKGTMRIGILDSVYTKEDFSDAVSGGQYQMGIVLEKINDTAIGQGALKQWKKINPNMRIILVMDKERYATGKVQGLYDREIYDGLFQSDFGKQPLFDLLDSPRSKEDAYDYYGLKKYEEMEREKKDSAEKENVETADIVLQPVLVSASNKTKREKPTFSSVSNLATSAEDNSASELKEEKPNAVNDSKNEPKPARSIELENAKSKESNSSIILNVGQGGDSSDVRKEDELVFEGSSGSDKVVKQHSESGEKLGTEEVITTLKTVNTKNVLNFLDDQEMISRYLSKVADTLKQVDNIPKTVDEEESMYGLLIKEYAFFKMERLNDVLRGIEEPSYFMSEVFDNINAYDAEAEEKKSAYYKFESFAFGYDCLERLIEMEDVSSIHVLDYNSIRVKKKNGRATANIAFMSREHYSRFVENLVQRNISTIIKEGLVSHFTDRTFSDKYTLSVSIFDGNSHSGGAKELVIKKSIKETRMIENLIGSCLTMKAAAVLVHAAQKRKGILLCGPRGSGVMQMMQILLNYIPLDKNGIVLQHRDELTANRHPELLVKQPVMGTDERAGYTLAQFAENALQRDIDYYILSDVRGAEVDSFYKAMNYGFTVWTTIKAMDCESALLTLVDSIIEQNPDYNRNAVSKVIADKFDYVVYMEKFEVLRIAQVRRNSYDAEKGVFNLNTVESKEANGV